jgi:hypothetical protein
LTTDCAASTDRSNYSLTGHSTSRDIAALSTQPAQDSTPSLADSMQCCSTGHIHHDCKSCRPHLRLRPSEPLLIIATSCPVLHNVTPALVLLATYATSTGPATDQPASAPAPSCFTSQRLSSHHRHTTNHGIHANTVQLT